MPEEISKFNLPGERRDKYGKDFFDDAGDEFARALDSGDMSRSESVPSAPREDGLDEDVIAAARDSITKYGR